MTEEIVEKLTEQDYCQLGKLEAIYFTSLAPENQYCDDFSAVIVRSIPRYEPPIDGTLGRILEDRFYWKVSGRFKNLISGGEVTITHGFKRQASAYSQQCCLEDTIGISGRKFVTKCDIEWDFVNAIICISPKTGYNYRYVDEHWEVFQKSATATQRNGDFWSVPKGKDFTEVATRVGHWEDVFRV